MGTAPLLALAMVLTASAAWAQRLPPGVVPLHYDLTLAPDLAAAKFTGQATIRVRLENPSPVIVLNAAEITFHEVHISAAGRTRPATVTLDPVQEQATLRVETAIPAGDAEILIAYDGILNDDLRGFYLSTANNRRYAVTQLEATDARRMFPSFDEPALKATFALTAVVDAAYRAISNGAIVSETVGPGRGMRTIRFDTTPKMSTYLVALAVGDFECNGTVADGIPVRICATPDKKHLTGFALEAAVQQLAYFNRYYSIRYPFKKLDVVAVPDFAAGAMENTAAIFYRETLLLADANASVDVRKDIAAVLAHEIAHQWFGNLVTMQWWDDIWLNEGFANWMMSKPVKAWRPDWHVELDEVDDNHVAMSLDSLRSTRSIRSKASTPAEIAELFDPIAYEKGAAVIRMLEGWVGEAPFRQAVNTYIETFQYGNARAEDFWGTLARVTGTPIDQVMPTFVDQPGVPLVSVEVSCGSNAPRVTLSQQRYFRDPAANAATAQLWKIPICVTLPDGATTCQLLTDRRASMAVSACPAWTMANAGARDYYRTALPPDVVREMSDEVQTLAAAERMVALSDEWALARAVRHDVGVTLDLAAGFAAEPSAAVLDTLASILAGVGNTLTATGTRVPYRAWVAGLVGPAFETVGTTARADDSDEDKRRRATLFKMMAGTAREGRALAAARDLMSREVAAPGSIDPTLLAVVVDLAAIQGDAALYERYLARSRTAKRPEERYLYLYALTSFTQAALVRKTPGAVGGRAVARCQAGARPPARQSRQPCPGLAAGAAAVARDAEEDW